MLAIVGGILIPIWLWHRSRNYPFLIPTDNLPFNGHFGYHLPPFEVSLRNTGSAIATNIWGVIFEPKPGNVAKSNGERYTLQGKTSLQDKESVSVLAIEGITSVPGDLQFGKYTLYAPQEASIIARLTLTYEDHSGRKYASIFDYTDQAHWREVKFLQGIRKDIKAYNDVIHPVPTIGPIHSHRRRIDWGDAPSIRNFYGREPEREELRQWVVSDRCRVVALLGIGGIGKTSLSARLTEQMKDTFDYVYWRSLQNASPLEDILEKCIPFLSDQKRISLPKDVDDQIGLLIDYLRGQRCWLVLDNFETILQESNHTGHCQDQYEGYCKLIRRVGEAEHQSCLILTSKEKPEAVALLEEGKVGPVRSLQLSGMGLLEGQQMLKDKGIFGSEEAWTALIHFYAGNPLALKLVAEPIRELFGGDIAEFLKQGDTIVSSVYDLLDQQFQHLSAIEKDIMYWLAIEREAVSLEGLREDIVRSVSKRELQATLESLRRLSMIESNGVAHFVLQPVVMEYITDKFIGQVCQEIDTEIFELFVSHALIKAQAKDYVMNSQVRFILKPIAERLLIALGNDGVENKFKTILSTLRATKPQKPGYAAGNVLNLLIQLKYDLSGYDFSHLTVWQAYMQGVAIHDVNFAYANLAKYVFTETFTNILSVAFSSNGELLAVATANDVRLLQADSGTPLLICQGHTDLVGAVAFSPVGTTLASGSNDQSVRIWDSSTGQCLNTLLGHTGQVWSVAFSSDGHILASSGDDQTVRLWEVSTGQCLNTLQEHTDQVWSVAFSPIGGMLVSGSHDHTVRVWDASTGKCLNTLQGHTGRVRSVTFSPDGTILASGSEDQTVRLWEVSTGQCLNTLQGHTGWVKSVNFSSNGRMLASGSHDHTVRLWEVSTGQCLNTLQGHKNWVWSAAFSPNGHVLASGSDDQTIRFWDPSTGLCLKTLQGYTNRARLIAFSPDGTMLACGNEDQAIPIWETSTGQYLKILQGHTGWVRFVAFSPNGRMLASCSDDYTIRLWEVSSGQCLKILHGHTNRVWSVAFSPDGKVLVSSGEDHTVRLWEVSTGQCLKTLQEHTNRVWSVCLSPDGRLLASGGEDHTVRLWEVSSGQCLKILQEHTNRIWSVAFSPDGRLLASGGDDQTIRLWEVSSGQCLKTLQRQSYQVRSVAFSPDGRLLASGSDDQTIQLWEVSTGQFLKALQGHTNRVWLVAFSPDGHTIASGSDDGTVRLWEVQTGVCLRTLRSDRPYERMNITNVRGLPVGQKATLKALGAIEN